MTGSKQRARWNEGHAALVAPVSSAGDHSGARLASGRVTRRGTHIGLDVITWADDWAEGGESYAANRIAVGGGRRGCMRNGFHVTEFGISECCWRVRDRHGQRDGVADSAWPERYGQGGAPVGVDHPRLGQ